VSELRLAAAVDLAATRALVWGAQLVCALGIRPPGTAPDAEAPDKVNVTVPVVVVNTALPVLTHACLREGNTSRLTSQPVPAALLACRTRAQLRAYGGDVLVGTLAQPLADGVALQAWVGNVSVRATVSAAGGGVNGSTTVALALPDYDTMCAGSDATVGRLCLPARVTLRAGDTAAGAAVVAAICNDGASGAALVAAAAAPPLPLPVSCPPFCPGTPVYAHVTAGAVGYAATVAAMPAYTTGGVLFARACDGMPTDRPDVDCLAYDAPPAACPLGEGAGCIPCPPGASCPGGYVLLPHVGFWLGGSSVPESGVTNDTAAGLAGALVVCNPPALTRCTGWDAVSGAPACGVGYASYACGACATGYYRGADGTCGTCPATGTSWEFLGPVAGLVGGLIGVAAVMLGFVLVVQRRTGGTLAGGAKRSVRFAASIFLALQAVVQVSKTAPPSVPPFMRAVYGSLDVLQADGITAPVVCLGSSVFTVPLLRMGIALALLVVFVATAPMSYDAGAVASTARLLAAADMEAAAAVAAVRRRRSLGPGALPGAPPRRPSAVAVTVGTGGVGKGGGGDSSPGVVSAPNAAAAVLARLPANPRPACALLQRVAITLTVVLYALVCNTALQMVNCSPARLPLATYGGLQQDGAAAVAAYGPQWRALLVDAIAATAIAPPAVDVRLLVSDPSIVCFEASHTAAFGVAVVVLAVVAVGMPVGTFLWVLGWTRVAATAATAVLAPREVAWGDSALPVVAKPSPTLLRTPSRLGVALPVLALPASETKTASTTSSSGGARRVSMLPAALRSLAASAKSRSAVAGVVGAASPPGATTAAARRRSSAGVRHTGSTSAGAAPPTLLSPWLAQVVIPGERRRRPDVVRVMERVGDAPVARGLAYFVGGDFTASRFVGRQVDMGFILLLSLLFVFWETSGDVSLGGVVVRAVVTVALSAGVATWLVTSAPYTRAAQWNLPVRLYLLALGALLAAYNAVLSPAIAGTDAAGNPAVLGLSYVLFVLCMGAAVVVLWAFVSSLFDGATREVAAAGAKRRASAKLAAVALGRDVVSPRASVAAVAGLESALHGVVNPLARRPSAAAGGGRLSHGPMPVAASSAAAARAAASRRRAGSGAGSESDDDGRPPGHSVARSVSARDRRASALQSRALYTTTQRSRRAGGGLRVASSPLSHTAAALAPSSRRPASVDRRRGSRRSGVHPEP